MRIFPALRKFNTVALAIALVLATALLIVMIVQSIRLNLDYSPPSGETKAAPGFWGERIKAKDRVISLYMHGEPNGDWHNDLRFIDSRDGSTVRFSEDQNQRFYSDRTIGLPGSDRADEGYGYVALAKRGDHDGSPVFDLKYLRFSDMKVFTLETNLRGFDDVVELDGKSFSAIIWDAQDRAKFILFDSELGKTVVSRDLGMRNGSARSDAKANEAPKAKYGF